MTKEEAEHALTKAVSQYVNNRFERLKTEKGIEEQDAFTLALLYTLEFCAGTVMSSFFIAMRQGPRHYESGAVLGEAEQLFPEMMTQVTRFVCDSFPRQLSTIDAVLAEKRK